MMLNLYRNTTSLVDHAHQTLDEAQLELHRVAGNVRAAAVLAYVAAVASILTLIAVREMSRRG